MIGTINLDAVGVFVQVAESASFRGAATLLGIPRSTVSRKIALLEHRLGTRLLRRTTRQVTLTDAGAAYLRACQPALGALAEASQAIHAEAVEAQGRLRVTASVTFGERYLGPMFEAYLRANPRVELDVLLADRQVDLIQEGFDVAFRAGDVGDPSLVAHELARGPLLCVASPSYLAARRAPRRPRDLADHDCIIYGPLAPGGRWAFREKNLTVRVPVRGRMIVNSLPLALDAASRGLGVARIPGALVAAALRERVVVEVLQRYLPAPAPFFLVHRSGAQTMPRLRAFVDLAKEWLPTGIASRAAPRSPPARGLA